MPQQACHMSNALHSSKLRETSLLHVDRDLAFYGFDDVWGDGSSGPTLGLVVRADPSCPSLCVSRAANGGFEEYGIKRSSSTLTESRACVKAVTVGGQICVCHLSKKQKGIPSRLTML